METLNYNRNIFSKNLCRLMEQNNMTAVELSKKIGVSQSTVSEWRKGKKAPRWNKLEQIAALFHVQKSDLIEDKSQTDLPEGAFPYNPIKRNIKTSQQGGKQVGALMQFFFWSVVVVAVISIVTAIKLQLWDAPVIAMYSGYVSLIVVLSYFIFLA